MSDSDTMRKLRRIDAADTHLDTRTTAGLDARMERLMAAEPAPTATATEPARRSRWTGGRLLALSGAAAVVAAGAIVMPSVFGSDAAYAGWSAAPSKVAARDLDSVVAACRKQIGPVGGEEPAGAPRADFDPATAAVVIAERRGDYVAVLLRGTGTADVSAFCVAENRPGSGEVDNLQSGAAGGSGPAQQVAPKTFMEASMAEFGGDAAAAFVDGVAGSEVAKVTIHAPGGTQIEATVENGRYAAWWPGRILLDEPLPPSGEGGPEPALTYDLTLSDGTIVKDARSWRPGGAGPG